MVLESNKLAVKDNTQSAEQTSERNSGQAIAIQGVHFSAPMSPLLAREFMKTQPGFFMNLNKQEPLCISDGVYDAEVVSVKPLHRSDDDRESLVMVTITFRIFGATTSDMKISKMDSVIVVGSCYPVDWRSGSRFRQVVESILGRPLDAYEARGGVFSKRLLFKQCRVRVRRTAHAIRFGTHDMRLLKVLPSGNPNPADIEQSSAA